MVCNVHEIHRIPPPPPHTHTHTTTTPPPPHQQHRNGWVRRGNAATPERMEVLVQSMLRRPRAVVFGAMPDVNLKYCINRPIANYQFSCQCGLWSILSWYWWNFLTSANQIAQIGSCDRSRIHVPDLVGTGVWPGKNGFHKKYKNLDNIAVYLIASLKSKWKNEQIKNMNNCIW